MTDIPENVREAMRAAALAAWNDAPNCPGAMYATEAAAIVDAALSALRAAGYEVRPTLLLILFGSSRRMPLLAPPAPSE